MHKWQKKIIFWSGIQCACDSFSEKKKKKMKKKISLGTLNLKKN